MPTSTWCGFCALLVAAQVLAIGGLAASPAQPWGTLFHALGIAAVALLAWIADGGRRPTAVVAGAMLLGFLAARGQGEFLAGAAAALATGAILHFKTGARKPCAESSPR